MAGLYYEDFHVDSVFTHSIRRTVTETDNILFTTLTHNTQPLHLDEVYAASTPLGTRVVNSVFTIGLIGGMTVTDMTLGTTLGNLGYENIRFPAPVQVGDTLRCETRIVSKRESKKWPDAGIVLFEHVGYNQHNEVVAVIARAGLMKKRPAPADEPPKG